MRTCALFLILVVLRGQQHPTLLYATLCRFRGLNAKLFQQSIMTSRSDLASTVSPPCGNESCVASDLPNESFIGLCIATREE
jgi:hypothetical protein